MTVIINPGSGPVNGTPEQAATAMSAFVADLRAAGHTVGEPERRPGADYENEWPGDGRYAFGLTVDGQDHEIQMPGLPVDQVRWINEPGQDIWDFPRLYVDDSSWVWLYALGACEPDEDDQ